MIKVILMVDEFKEKYFDIHSDTEGEMEFVMTTLNTLCPKILNAWASTDNELFFESTEFDRWEVLWCITEEDTEGGLNGWPLAHKIYSYTESFGFDIEIVKEKLDEQ